MERCVGNVADWVKRVMMRMKGDEVGKRMVILWACWNGRNEQYYGDGRTNVLDIARCVADKALSYWEEWKKTQLECEIDKSVHIEEIVKWKPPQRGFWKINVDAAIMGEMGSGMGMVIRDFEGKVERAGVVQVYEKWTPEITEAKASEFGLRTARQMGL
ncbi:uncharacterized protein LOC141616904 [Silene latifolia]|uniref:uncharacterized protein LOC141616904 n=1 Tax=Silene latifolia TaxID=37657 RepID=UPI003D78AAAD